MLSSVAFNFNLRRYQSGVYRQVIKDGIYRPVEAWMDFGQTLDFAGGLWNAIHPICPYPHYASLVMGWGLHLIRGVH